MSNIHPVFRAEKKDDRLFAAFVHSDGHVVTVFERYLPDLDTEVKYAKVAEGLISTSCKGRIAFTSPEILVTAIAAGAKGVRVVPNSIAQGSQNTQRQGIAIGRIEFTGGDWGKDRQLCWHSIEGMNPGWTEQGEGCGLPFDPNASSCDGHKILKVYRKKDRL